MTLLDSMVFFVARPAFVQILLAARLGGVRSRDTFHWVLSKMRQEPGLVQSESFQPAQPLYFNLFPTSPVRRSRNLMSLVRATGLNCIKPPGGRRGSFACGGFEEKKTSVYASELL